MGARGRVQTPTRAARQRGGSCARETASARAAHSAAAARAPRPATAPRPAAPPLRQRQGIRLLQRERHLRRQPGAAGPAPRGVEAAAAPASLPARGFVQRTRWGVQWGGRVWRYWAAGTRATCMTRMCRCPPAPPSTCQRRVVKRDRGVAYSGIQVHTHRRGLCSGRGGRGRAGKTARCALTQWKGRGKRGGVFFMV